MLATIVPVFGPFGNVLVAILLGLIVALVLIRRGEPLAVQGVSPKVWRVVLIYAAFLVLSFGVLALIGWIATDPVRPPL